MNSNVEAVEPAEGRRPLSQMFEHFYVYLYNVLTLFFNIFLGLLNILAFSTTQGHLYLGSLMEWVWHSAGNSGHKGRMRSKDLATGRFLGQGCSGILYETTWSRSQDSTMRLARKDFPGVKGGIFKGEVIRLFELGSHPNVVKTLGWTVDGRSCSLVMEYVTDDLSSLMRRKKEAQRKSKGNQLPVIGTSLTIFRLHEALDIALQIAIGMEYLHDKGITHGDLKPNNILIDWKDGQPLVKVADFGLIATKRRSTLISQRALCYRMIEWSAPELFEEYFGSLGKVLDYLWTESPTGSDVSTSSTANIYDCPEVLMTKADSYSFALTCACIFGGQMWDAKLSPSKLRRRISISGLRPKLPSECPESLVSLMTLCWDTNPKRRPTFSFIRNRLQEIIKEQSMVQVHASNLWRSNVSEGLRIIEDVNRFSGNFLMNKHQCERLSNCLKAVGERLKEMREELFNNGAGGLDHMINTPFDFLLIILRKARALLLKYSELRTSRESVLTRREDREAFKEIHVDLDMLNSQFHFQDVISEIEKVAMLTTDADTDLRELSESLHDLAHGDDYKKAAAATFLPTDVEIVKTMVSEKSYGTSTGDHALPSYLRIDLANVEIREPVRMPLRLSQRDPVETFGWALVRHGTWLGCEFALKVFKSGDPDWNSSELLKEVRSLMELQHPHVVRLVGFGQDEEKCIILMELMDTDLRHFMKPRLLDGKRPFTRSEEMDIISQIAKGMYFVHDQQYVHGELKCSNILVKQIDEHIDVKIADFRSSHKLGVWDPVKFEDLCQRRRPRWTAPEVTRFREAVEPTHAQLKKTDVYSFGMVCYEVVTGRYPFDHLIGDALERRIANGDVKQELPGDLDENLKVLIESCWELDPDLRPTFEEICHRLAHIRSPQFALSKWDSEVFTDLRRMVPSVLRPRGRDQLMDPPKISSWEVTVEPISGASPQFVRTDPGDVKKGASWGHTNLECTGEQCEGEGEDDADEGCEGKLDSAKVGANSVITLPGFVRINPTELKLERLIGKGSFADVYVGTWLDSRFAVKRLKYIQPRDVVKELKILCELRHPCIVQLIGASVRSEHGCSIVMELMGGDLRNLIDTRMQSRLLSESGKSKQTAGTALLNRDNLRTRATTLKKLRKTMGPILARDDLQKSSLGMRNKASEVSHEQSKARVQNRSHKQPKRPSKTSKRPSKASKRLSMTSKQPSKVSRPDLQQHSGLRKQNRMYDQVLEGSEKLQQHINSRKPKEVKPPAVLHSDVVPFDLHEAVYIITRIALGMAFLHARGVVHRDLKGANVLVPEHPGSIDVKIADFGVAEILTTGEKLSFGVGTDFWVAPETFIRRSSGEDQGTLCMFDLKAADVYSFAMICYEVLTGKIPMKDELIKFVSRQELKLAVVGGLRPTLPHHLNSDLKLLIEECWDGNPEKRPTFSSICTRLQKIQHGLPSSS